jgi:RNA polymerase sigma factor (sigma-70 family)
MARAELTSVLWHLRTLIGVRHASAAPDWKLLDAFAAQRDETAFAELVQRHGGLVIGVCRRLLADAHEAEDVFQATFLVLARKAGSFSRRESLPGWLYRVAYRLALRARARSAQRRLREKSASDLPRNERTMADDPLQPPAPAANPAEAAARRDLRLVLDEELQRLPARYRDPLLLCYFEGKTSDQAARELGFPVGSMSWHLARAREALRERLSRRGVLLSTALLATALTEELVQAAPASLVTSSAGAAFVFASGGLSSASTEAVALAEELLRAMGTVRFRVVAGVLLGVVAVATAGTIAYWSWPSTPQVTDQVRQQPAPRVVPALPDWPMWGRDASRNMVSQEKNPPAVWDVISGRNIKWTAKLGSRSLGNPVVANGLIWVGTNNQNPRDPAMAGDASVLMCFRESDGAFLYQYVSPRLTDGPLCDADQASMSCSPLIEKDRLWFTTNRCEVVCLDIGPLQRGTGQPHVVWTLDMRSELGVFPRTVLLGHTSSIGASYRELLYVVTGNGVDGKGEVPAPEAPSLVCLNKKTGNLVWCDLSPGKDILLGQWASPLVAEINGRGQVIVPQGDGWLRSFDARSGRLLWKCDLNPKDAVWEAGGRGTRNYAMATPVLYDNRVYIGSGQKAEVGEGPGRFYCIDPTREGDISLELEVEPGKGKLNPNCGIVWQFGGPIVGGDQTWARRDHAFCRTLSTCAIQDGLVYIADVGGYFYCLDARTGARQWNHDLEGIVWGSPLWVDGRIYIGTDAGDIWIFNHGREKTEPRRIKMGQRIHSTPVFVHGVLYAMTDTTLYAIAEKK